MRVYSVIDTGNGDPPPSGPRTTAVPKPDSAPSPAPAPAPTPAPASE